MNDQDKIAELAAEIARLNETIKWYQGQAGQRIGEAARAGIAGAPVREAGEVPAVSIQMLREAASWGRTYGPLLSKRWYEMRDGFIADLLASTPTALSEQAEPSRLVTLESALAAISYLDQSNSSGRERSAREMLVAPAAPLPEQTGPSELEAENERLRDALADKVSASTLLTELSMKGNSMDMTFEGGACRLLAEQFGKQFRDAQANNYLEIGFICKDGLRLLVTLQRCDGKTPANLKAEAEAKLAQVEKELAGQRSAASPSPAPAQQQEPSDEYGWLIEKGPASAPLYRTIEQGMYEWTLDNMKALRFCRRMDADMFAAEDPEDMRIAQHVWVGESVETAAPGASIGDDPEFQRLEVKYFEASRAFWKLMNEESGKAADAARAALVAFLDQRAGASTEDKPEDRSRDDEDWFFSPNDG